MQTFQINTKEKREATGDLFGIFFEDINHAADGGLYAELVQNRAFEFDPIDNKKYHALYAWMPCQLDEKNGQTDAADVSLTILTDSPYTKKNPHYLRITANSAAAGVKNLGFNSGIALEGGETYHFSCYLRKIDEPVTVKACLIGKEGQIYASCELTADASDWKKYTADLKIAEGTSCTDANLALVCMTPGSVEVDFVSLFPAHTYKNRPNGLRKDLCEMLEAMHPKFIRFPGGCLVHDGQLDENARDSMYRWKNTIGPVEERPARRNNWGYNQTLGLGYYEYFQLAEDIGAEPLPVLPAAYDPHHQRKVPLDELGPWIDDALDLIEFANGDETTVWGKKRADMGHPKPFGLHYLAIGNEEVGEGFTERYPYFHKAIREKYPDIKLIGSASPFAAGGEYERGWASARECGCDLIDEHYYMNTDWMIANVDRYDNFLSSDPKVFLGEYASWGNQWENGLVEAAFMTGLEKNVHAVGLACYAPMFANVDYVNWRPDMIWFDNHQAYGTANYYVQKLFMNHQGNDRIELEMTGIDDSVTIQDDPKGGFGLRIEPDTVVRYSQIMVEDIQNSTIWKDSEVYFVGDKAEQYLSADPDARVVTKDILLHTVESDHYIITVKGEMLYGRRGFMLQYGNRDEKNRYQWEIGGWQNMDSALTQDIAGRNSCLTQSSFTVAADREYELKLEIEGRHLRAYIDGELIHEIHHAPVKIEPLYTAASIDRQSGDVIVKLVNVQKRPIDTVLHMEGIEQAKGTAYIMSGFALKDENSFAEPLKVSPREEEIQLTQGCCSCHIDGESVQVLRFQKS